MQGETFLRMRRQTDCESKGMGLVVEDCLDGVRARNVPGKTKKAGGYPAFFDICLCRMNTNPRHMMATGVEPDEMKVA